MKHQVFLTERKLKHVLKLMSKNVKVLDGPSVSGTIPIEITIAHPFDVLDLIHAGEMAGLEFAHERQS